MNLSLLRLDPSDASAWRWWPEFEQRVGASVLLFTPRTPVERVVGHLRRLWATAPVTLGAWLILRDPVPGNGHLGVHAVGHLCSWVVTDEWGEVMILLYQLRVDRGIKGRALGPAVLRDLEAWRQALNALYQREQITRVKFFTQRGMGVWARYLKGMVEVVDVEQVAALDMPTVRLPERMVSLSHGGSEGV